MTTVCDRGNLREGGGQARVAAAPRGSPPTGVPASAIVIFWELLLSPDIHPSPGEQPIVSPMSFLNPNYYYKGREREREGGIPYKKGSDRGNLREGGLGLPGVSGLGLGGDPRAGAWAG